jgi:hypothetical protein
MISARSSNAVSPKHVTHVRCRDPMLMMLASWQSERQHTSNGVKHQLVAMHCSRSGRLRLEEAPFNDSCAHHGTKPKVKHMAFACAVNYCISAIGLQLRHAIVSLSSGVMVPGV